MMTDSKRRLILKGAMTASAASAAAMAGLLTPQAVIAAWNESAFNAKAIDKAIEGVMGSSTTETTDTIVIKAPDIAENGAVVPVSVKTSMAGVSSIALLVEKNGTPMSAVFNLPESTLPEVSTRLKMGKTGDVIAVVKSGGKLYSARKSVKVTIGGCGG
jgi:sulfur-oxidizing protein SoxY